MASGLLLALSFPPAGLAPVAWFAPAPLLRAIARRRAAGRLALGSVAGFAWSGCMVGFWLYPAARDHLAAGPLAAAALTAAAAWIYGGVYLAAFALVHSWLPRPRWLAAPAAWVLLEEVRTRFLGGAPWGLLGHTQHAMLPLAQLTELTGVAGLSFLVLLPAAALAERDRRERRRGLAAAAIALAVAGLYGTVRLAAFPAGAPADADLDVQVFGGQNLADDPLGRYVAATVAAPPAALTVWPEGAVPGYLQEEPAAAAAVATAARAKGWLLVGSRRYEGLGSQRRYFNSARLFDPAGQLRATYDKRRLVPFAEYEPLPFPHTVDRPYTAGASEPAPLAAGALRLGPLICWEAIFPEPARRYARAGVDVLVNLTSDRELGAGVAQQVAYSRFRAIETRRWFIRASGTGPTMFIDPAGRIRSETRLRVGPGAAAPPTFYVRHPNVVPSAAAILLAFLLVGGRRERPDVPRHERGGVVGAVR